MNHVLLRDGGFFSIRGVRKSAPMTGRWKNRANERLREGKHSWRGDLDELKNGGKGLWKCLLMLDITYTNGLCRHWLIRTSTTRTPTYSHASYFCRPPSAALLASNIFFMVLFKPLCPLLLLHFASDRGSGLCADCGRLEHCAAHWGSRNLSPCALNVPLEQQFLWGGNRAVGQC